MLGGARARATSSAWLGPPSAMRGASLCEAAGAATDGAGGASSSGLPCKGPHKAQEASSALLSVTS